jgi:hypothetical protein
MIGITWFLQARNGQLVALHNGGNRGFQSAIRLLPARHVAVIVLANKDNAGAIELADKVLGIVLGEEQ